MDVMPFDELNKFVEELPKFFDESGKRIKSKEDYDSLLDMLEDLLFLAYAHGVSSTNLSLSSNVEPTLDEMLDVVERKINGKTWRERMREYYEIGNGLQSAQTNGGATGYQSAQTSGGVTGSMNDVVRLAETETHRDANAGAFNTAKKAGATKKVWHTMMDDKVRDSHYWLEGVSAPIDGEFYNYKGQSTQYPSQWGIAEEDINCRCWLTFS